MNLQKKDVIIIGSGPGGYSAAVKLSQLGRRVTLIEKKSIGGVCLNEGCIPCKSLITAARLLTDAKKAEGLGIKIEIKGLDLPKLNQWKDDIVSQSKEGVTNLLASNQVEILAGEARFVGNRVVEVNVFNGEKTILEGEQVLIAAGSSPSELAGISFDGRMVWSAQQALDVSSLPREVIIVGGGVIGVELATVYSCFGCKVNLIEKENNILPGYDKDLRRMMASSLRRLGINIKNGVSLEGVSLDNYRVEAVIKKGPMETVIKADRLITCTGRKPNTSDLGLAKTGVEVSLEGFIQVDPYGRTSAPGIYAIGDITGTPCLAHKAYHQAVLASRDMAGDTMLPKTRAIPYTIFSLIEAAGVGLTEEEAAQRGITIRTGYYPLSASGRSATMGISEGFVKVLAGADNDQVLGVHIVGAMASELVSEAVLAVDSGISLGDFADVIRPHPTISESLTESALAALQGKV